MEARGAGVKAWHCSHMQDGTHGKTEMTPRPLPEPSLHLMKPVSLHCNHLPLRPWSSVILWFYYSIFKPVEWECFWVACSHRWWWEESQEYVVCSKCPLHYVITPFTFHTNKDEIILKTAVKARTVQLQQSLSTHTCVWNTTEEFSPNYVHLGLRTLHMARANCASAPHAKEEWEASGGKAKGTNER